MVTMPNRAQRQYRRKLLRAWASVATARVSCANRVVAGPSDSASSVQAIFTWLGSAYAANWSTGIGVKPESACHGRQAAPHTIR